MTLEGPAQTGNTEVGAAPARPAGPPVRLPESRQKEEWDLFISYSRKDKVFAGLLHATLSSYRPPRTLAVPQRYLRAFLDVNDAYGPDYEQAIHARLKEAAKLVVVCSPNSRASRFVDPEIRAFMKDHPAANIVSLIVDGLPNNEADGPTDPRNAFPAALAEAQGMPLAIDYRGFDPRKHRVDQGTYQNAWFTLLANIYGHSRAEIEERERKRQARQRRIRAAILTAVGAALLALSVWALWERDGAIAQRDRAFASRLAAQANLLLTDPQESSPIPILLAAHSFRYGPAPQSVRAIGEGMRRLPPLLVAEMSLKLSQYPRPEQLVFSPQARYLAVREPYVTYVIDLAAKKEIASVSGKDGNPFDLVFARNEETFAVAEGGNPRRLRIFRPGVSDPVWESASGDFSFAESEEGWRVATLSADKHSILVRDPLSGRTVLSERLSGEGSAIALSADGKFVAAASGRHVTMFDLAQAAGKREIDLPAPARTLALARGGELLAVVHPDGKGAIWSLAEREKKADLQDGAGKVRAAEFTTHGRFLKVARENGRAMIETEKFRSVVLEQAPVDASAILLQAQGVSARNDAVQVQFVNEERALFVARQQGDLILWSGGLLPSFGMFGVISGFSPAFRLDHGTTIKGASASEDGTRVLSFGTAGGMSPMGTMIVASWAARLWDGPAKQEIARITNRRGLIGAVSSSGDLLATVEPGDEQGVLLLRIWSAPKREPFGALAPAWKDAGPLMFVAADGKHLAGRTRDGLMLGDTDSATKVAPSDGSQIEPTGAFSLSGDGRLALNATASAVELFDVAQRKPIDRIPVPRTVASAALSHDGRYVAVSLIDREAFAAIMQRAPRGDFSIPDGQLVTQVWDREAKAWAWSFTHRQLGFVQAVSDDGRRVVVQRLDYSPELADNPMIRVGGGMPARSALEIWQRDRSAGPLASFTPRQDANAPRMGFLAASFDRSGEHFAVVLDAQTAVVGLAATGEEIATLEPYGRVAEAFNPSAAGSEAKSAWGRSVAFSDDGKYLLTAGVTITNSLFSARYGWKPEDQVAMACARLPKDQRELSQADVQQYFGEAKPRPICDGSSLGRESELLFDKLRGGLARLMALLVSPVRGSAR